MRTEIRIELGETRLAFQRLVSDIPDQAWEAPSRNPSWNVRQMTYHIVMAVQLLPQDIKMIRAGRMITPPAWLFDKLNIWITRWRARGHTKQSVSEAYDTAHNEVLELLDDINEDEWQLSGNYPNLGGYMPGGEHTIADMFHYLTLHFQEHEADVREVFIRYTDP